ncbi:hypothetical protein [Maribacter halichondriae]|uniref:hypothetical protein n=1 Tax=Maribacter halichondriae TaxID=2980554 RepID=UPI0023589274|nr:hypothetical protein [Maribacter sp. Hal144]
MRTRMKIAKRLFSVLFIACLITACSKDGNDGAIGPQGPQGEQGPAGPQGSDGADGETGTANVIFSPWITSGFNEPIATENANFSIDAPEITQEVIDSGAILVYGRDSDGQVFALPVTLHNTSTDESYHFTFDDPGSLEISVSEINGDDLDNLFIDDAFRYVIIPGGNPTSGKAASSINYYKMTYEELAAHFGIQD